MRVYRFRNYAIMADTEPDAERTRTPRSAPCAAKRENPPRTPRILPAGWNST